ncbi:MAG: cytochrome c biogenesis CcdA family protein [Spirochaetales bacterium]
MPEEVDLGRVETGSVQRGDFSITNSLAEPVAVSLLSSDPALVLSASEIVVPAGGSVNVAFELTIPERQTGELIRIVTVLADEWEPDQALAVVIRWQGPPAPDVTVAENAPHIDIYMDVTCPKCRAIVEETIPAAFGETPYALQEFDVLVPENMSALLERLYSRGASLAELPVAFVDMRSLAASPDAAPVILQGFEGIERGVWVLATSEGREVDVSQFAGQARPSEQNGGATAEVSDALTIGAIIGAGLLDGINPCAFSTMLFPISMLAVAGRTKREILIIGIVYSLTVFFGYVLAGFGLFAGVRSLMVFPTLVAVMRWTLFGLLLVLAALSVRDAVLAGQGRASEMTLQLPDKFKRRVHSVVRSGTRKASLVGGTILLGIGVTIFEFSCTGQVYVPVIMHLARTGSGSTVGLLLLYNLAFILPLLIVFALAYAGVSMKKLGTAFGDRLVLVKLGLAVVFAGFAVLTVVV